MDRCCVEAKQNLNEAQIILSQFATIHPIYAQRLEVRDMAQEHLKKCAKTRLMRLAARIIRNAEGR